MGIIAILVLSLLGLALRGEPRSTDPADVAMEFVEAPGIDAQPGEAELARCMTPERARRIRRRI